MSGNINVERLKSYTSGNDVLIKKLLQSFVNNIPSQLDQLKDSVLANDYTNVRELAHKLKTPFLYIGVDDVAGKLSQIENAAGDFDHTTLVRDINWIVNVGNTCVDEARQIVEK